MGQASVFDDAVAALQALGMKPAQASRSVATALRLFDDQDAVGLEELVRKALQTK